MKKPRKRAFSLIPDYGNVSKPRVRAKYGYLQAGVSTVFNVLLFIVKFSIGMMIYSIALMADAFNNLSDIGKSMIVVLGFKASKTPPDKKHPFGHGRAEYIATLILGIVIVLAGIELIGQSINRIIHPLHILGSIVVVLIVFVTAIIKILMALFARALGKKIQSSTLMAEAWDCGCDAVSSTFVGIAIICAIYGYPIADPVLGIAVSALIVYTGVRIARRSSDHLMGTAPPEKTLMDIERSARSVEGVHDVHKVLVHDYGTQKFISLHIEVEDDISAKEAHTIAETVENRIISRTRALPIVHVDPSRKVSIPFATNMEKVIRHILKGYKDIVSPHKIEIVSDRNGRLIKMHIIVDRAMSVEGSHELTHKLRSSIQKRFKKYRVDVHIEPCVKDCNACSLFCEKREN